MRQEIQKIINNSKFFDWRQGSISNQFILKNITVTLGPGSFLTERVCAMLYVKGVKISVSGEENESLCKEFLKIMESFKEELLKDAVDGLYNEK